MPDLSYLVMTAADCSAYNEEHPHKIVSLNQMLEVRAQEQADTVCVGFTTKTADGFGCDTLTFSQLFEEVCKTAQHLQRQSSNKIRTRAAGDTKAMPIALLAPSCKDFLTNVFSLFRLGYSVLLIAPQNTPEDIAHLCNTVGASQLVYHEAMKKAANTAASHLPGHFQLVELVKTDDLANVAFKEAVQCRSALTPEEESETECIIFHSSGSSGTPKPIPQKHRSWTRAASCKPHSPSFTTTPLFHGGISDLLRAMMSCSTLYMYPSTLPITSDNLLQAFKAAPTPPASFLSVPYILEMLAEIPEGMQTLAGFELVSTGGSPLPTATGDRFCREGVKLVSRYGSSECGFLMTSFRYFDNDKDWSYLRPAAGKDWLSFEDQGDESYELIVPPQWPTRSKANREDGSFATSDLFKKHPTTPNAWLLTGRSDDVLLLVNGEKASPAPLEAILKASSSVSDAIVFGSNRSTLGLAVIPASPTVKKEDILSAILDANKIAPAHAQIAPELLVILPVDASFPRASKGSLQRGRAYEAFAKEIDNAYKAFDSAATGLSGEQRRISGEELLVYIKDTVKQTLGVDSIGDDEDLFTSGLNSLQSVRIRNTLQNTLYLGKEARLPTNIVFECATIRRLAEHIDELRTGASGGDVDRDLQLMRDLAGRKELVGFSAPTRETEEANGANGYAKVTCVLTGATGSLGAQLVPQLLVRGDVSEVCCLCRADDDATARKRVMQNLEKQRIHLPADAESRLRCLSSSSDQQRLGLAEDVYQKLAGSALLVIHAAWPVHFGAGLNSFIPHLQGLHNLIELAAQSSQSKFYFCSSTASVLGAPSRYVPEKISITAEDAVSMGYARSKHVAETICQAAWDQQLKGRIGILRLGQLCGDTKEGIWKPEEGWPLLVSSLSCVGCLPDLKEILSWLPLDKAAHATCDVAFNSEALATEEEVPVFHVVSTSSTKTFQDVLEAVKSSGISFEIVPTKEWLARLQRAQEAGDEHPCLKMLDLWQKSYGSTSGDSAEPIFETKRVEQLTEALSEPISQELMAKMIQYWQSIDLITATR